MGGRLRRANIYKIGRWLHVFVANFSSFILTLLLTRKKILIWYFFEKKLKKVGDRKNCKTFFVTDAGNE